MASAQVVETSVTNNSSQDSNHPDDLFQSRYVTPGFKPFSYNYCYYLMKDHDDSSNGKIYLFHLKFTELSKKLSLVVQYLQKKT